MLSENVSFLSQRIVDAGAMGTKPEDKKPEDKKP
jgi:hypothetical protein